MPNPASHLIDVVIVHWNSLDELQKCLGSLVLQHNCVVSSITVVNNSLDESCSAIATEYQNINVISPDKNLGFGGGCNFGAKRGHSPFILFLNPDIYFPPSSMDKLSRELNRPSMNHEIGITGVQLLNSDGSIQKNIARFPAFWAFFPRMLGLDRIFPGLFPPHYQKDIDYSKAQMVDQIPGAFFLVKRTTFEILGGFDEDFFMYYEDVDFCYRAHQSGWKTLYDPAVQVVHKGGGTTEVIRSARLFFSLRSKLLYVRKHFGVISMLAVFIGVYLLELPGRVINSVLSLSIRKLAETFKAYLMLTGYYLGIKNRT